MRETVLSFTFRDDGVHVEVLVEKALPRITVAFEHQEVTIVRNFSTNGTDRVSVKEFRRGPLPTAPKLPLLLAVVLGTLAHATLPRVVDSRNQLQVAHVLRNVGVVHLRQVVLVQATFQANPGVLLHDGLVLDNTKNVGHLVHGHHLLLVSAHRQVSHVLDGVLHVRLLVRFDVDVPFHVFRRHDRLDLKRAVSVLKRDDFPHQLHDRGAFFSEATLHHPQIRVFHAREQGLLGNVVVEVVTAVAEQVRTGGVVGILKAVVVGDFVRFLVLPKVLETAVAFDFACSRAAFAFVACEKIFRAGLPLAVVVIPVFVDFGFVDDERVANFALLSRTLVFLFFFVILRTETKPNFNHNIASKRDFFVDGNGTSSSSSSSDPEPDPEPDRDPDLDRDLDFERDLDLDLEREPEREERGEPEPDLAGDPDADLKNTEMGFDDCQDHKADYPRQTLIRRTS